MSTPKTGCPGLSLEMPSDPVYLKVLRGVCHNLAEVAGFPEDQRRLIALGLEEACTNIMRHAYQNCCDRLIRVQFRLEPEALVVELVDWGRKVRKDELKSRDLNDIRPGGLGVHFISEVFDRFEYDSSHELQNCLRLVKARPA